MVRWSVRQWTRRQNLLAGITFSLLLIAEALSLTKTATFLLNWLFLAATHSLVVFLVVSVLKFKARRLLIRQVSIEKSSPPDS